MSGIGGAIGGAVGGQVTGGAIGTVLGSVVPGLGNIVGGVVGTAVGGFLDNLFGKKEQIFYVYERLPNGQKLLIVKYGDNKPFDIIWIAYPNSDIEKGKTFVNLYLTKEHSAQLRSQLGITAPSADGGNLGADLQALEQQNVANQNQAQSDKANFEVLGVKLPWYVWIGGAIVGFKALKKF